MTEAQRNLLEKICIGQAETSPGHAIAAALLIAAEQIGHLSSAVSDIAHEYTGKADYFDEMVKAFQNIAAILDFYSCGRPSDRDE